MVLKINDRFRNRTVKFFNNFTLNLTHNSVSSTFSLDFLFDPENPEHKELACIAHYHECTLEFNGELVVSGYILSQNFKHSQVKEMVSIGGYSKTGVLDDCNIPTNLYPLQFDGLSLRQIAQRLIQPFDLKMQVDSEISALMDKSFDSSNASESQTIKAYLTELARQKNIIISHNAQGDLLFTKSKTNLKPILEFNSTNSIPGTRMDLSFNGQGMHSHITVQKQAGIDGGNAGEYTIKNPYVFTVYRPTTTTMSSGDDNDIELAARRALSNEIKNLTLSIETDRWLVDGKIIRPNNIITVLSPEIYLFKKSKWFIESVNFKGNNTSTTAVLNCVLPEVYTNEIPVYLFKGINLHA